MIERTIDLPHGYRVTFRWSPAGFVTEWDPDLPHVHQRRVRRRFLTAYDGARNDFMRDVAHAVGGSVLVLDLEGTLHRHPCADCAVTVDKQAS
jgi:hypothetical protein